MILDRKHWEHWEEAYQRGEPVLVDRNFRLMDAMYEEARALGHFTSIEPLEGLEGDILYAKAINVPAPSRPSR